MIGIKSQLKSIEYIPFCLVTHNGNSKNAFIEKFKHQLEISNHNIHVEFFDRHFFDNIQGYNDLLCSAMFYERFIDYDFIIVSQPDVYLLDQRKLLELPSVMQRYDYLGAPWINYTFNTLSLKNMKRFFPVRSFLNKLEWYVLHFFKLSIAKKILPLSWVYFSGNGGFSVRRTKSMIHYLNTLNAIERSAISDFRKNADTGSDLSVFAEDIFWGLFPLAMKKKFKVAPASIAVKYAWEQGNENRLNYYSNNSIPLAVHAWMKLDLKKYVLDYERKNQ
jgi:hypothetical protein